MQIKGNAFIITGGANGLGEGVVRTFAGLGGKLVIFDVGVAEAEQLVLELGKDSVYFPGPVDVASEESVQEGVRKAFERFGRIAGCVNCAGIIRAGLTAAREGEYGFWGLQTVKDFRSMIDVNLVGTFSVTQKVALRMVDQEPFNEDEERGVFIQASSLASSDGQMGAVGYAGTKGAISAMLLPMARDLSRYGIRFNAIAPGVFYTPMSAGFLTKDAKPHEFPPRLGRSDEFASLVVQLVENSMMNGTTVRLDAGMRNPRPELINPGGGEEFSNAAER
ncbi:Dehydrogenase [Geranomyces variabilis]|nr:Dehydrogenase [Geranomyces variabilis]